MDASGTAQDSAPYPRIPHADQGSRELNHKPSSYETTSSTSETTVETEYSLLTAFQLMLHVHNNKTSKSYLPSSNGLLVTR